MELNYKRISYKYLYGPVQFVALSFLCFESHDLSNKRHLLLCPGLKEPQVRDPAENGLHSLTMTSINEGELYALDPLASVPRDQLHDGPGIQLRITYRYPGTQPRVGLLS